ncbi:MAG TPA: hypothetical protein VFB80_09485 [Pirellulaceae bacterium]|nr:hypothetical protein [Pirellulaceae bacterium]
MEKTAFLARRLHQDESREGWETTVRASDLAVGQRVRVTSGPLNGLTGVVAGQAANGNWVVDIAESARGVLLCIRAHQLARAD